MIIETVRYAADVLDDVTVGVNAKIAAIGLDGTDSRPSNVAAVLNEFDSPKIARRQIDAGSTTPLIAIFQPREVELDGWVTTEVLDARDVPVAMVVVQKDADSEEANLAAAYYVRAMMQSINSVATGDSRRTRNNVQILNHRNTVFITPWIEVGNAWMSR
jgi:hypothetical protein